MGLPTTVERPTTTARRPRSGTSSRRRISITAAAVAGGNAPGRPAARMPRDAGLAPSTSLCTAMLDPTAARSTPSGSGLWQMTPCTAGSADNSASLSAISKRSPGGGSRWMRQSIPAAPAARSMDRTYQAALSSPVGTTTARAGITPRSRSRAADLAVCSRMAAAIALPSMTCVILDSPAVPRTSGCRARPLPGAGPAGVQAR